MESNYRNRDFEEYLKENADQYRMFPSENVWKGINGTLHSRRKWYGAGLILLLLLTGTAVTWVMVSYPVSKNQPVVVEAKVPIKETPQETVTPDIISKPFTSRTNSPQRRMLTPALESPVIPSWTQDDHTQIDRIVLQEPVSIMRPEKDPASSLAGVNKPVSIVPAVESVSDKITSPQTSSSATATKRAPETLSDRPARFEYNPNLENVATAYIPKKNGKRISWQWYITPTISYRKLGENKTSDNSSNPSSYVFASMNSDVNKNVTHKPDMGLQLGLAAGYPITSRLKIRGGLQFNINRYDIKAYSYNPEVTTFNLLEANGINSVPIWTQFRTKSGYQSDWLKNYYVSVSAPIGAELRLLGNDKTSFGVAGTIQPTYIIKDKAYLISTDHKNYAKIPSLVRHVNVNAGFETFVNFTTSKTRWQIGPQVRYQMLSSFQNKYPVRENLFDFGIKMGMMLE